MALCIPSPMFLNPTHPPLPKLSTKPHHLSATARLSITLTRRNIAAAPRCLNNKNQQRSYDDEWSGDAVPGASGKKRFRVRETSAETSIFVRVPGRRVEDIKVVQLGPNSELRRGLRGKAIAILGDETSTDSAFSYVMDGEGKDFVGVRVSMLVEGLAEVMVPNKRTAGPPLVVFVKVRFENGRPVFEWGDELSSVLGDL